MATYYVDGRNGNDTSGTGSNSNPWKSLRNAHNRISAGDTVRIRTATYSEVLTITKDSTIWQADDGHQPVLDGGYNESLFVDGRLPGPAGFLPGETFNNMIRVTASNVVINGLTLQNIAGVAIGVQGDRCTVRNCRIDFCYGGGIIMNSGSTLVGPLIENNNVTRCAMQIYDPNRPQYAPQSVQGTMNMIRVDSGIVRHNIVAYNHGEGINIGKGSQNCIVEGNVVHTNNHLAIYINRARNSTIRNNFIYHLYLPEYLGSDGKAPDGIVIGDETAATGFAHSRSAAIYNNIVVGMSDNFNVRNGKNYNTQLSDVYIGYNTFVAGRMTKSGVTIIQNKNGRPHEKTLVENNVILATYGAPSRTDGGMSGVVLRNNLWSALPHASFRGENDRIGDPRLTNPEAQISGQVPGPTNADPFNYRLTESSVLAIGRASDGTMVNNVRPPAIARDFFNGSRDNLADIGAHEYAGVVSQISANFSIGPEQQSGIEPHTVDFMDKSTSTGTIIKWSWDFGDGTTSDQQNPAHTYMQTGSFDVKLTVEDDNGLTDTLVQQALITVLPDAPDLDPADFRRFVLVKVGTATPEYVAYGTQYPDLTCVVLWNSEPFHVLNYFEMKDVAAAHEKPGENQLMWLDPVQEPVAADE